MTKDVTIAGDGCRLVLHVAGYERPQLDSGADANWLQAEVELDLEASGGSFQARRSVSLRTNELAAFRDQLAALVETLNGEVVLTHIEEWRWRPGGVRPRPPDGGAARCGGA